MKTITRVAALAICVGVVGLSGIGVATANPSTPSANQDERAVISTCQNGQIAVAAALTGSASANGRIQIDVINVNAGPGTFSDDWEGVLAEGWRTVTSPSSTGGTFRVNVAVSGGAYVLDSRVDCIWAKDLPNYIP